VVQYQSAQTIGRFTSLYPEAIPLLVEQFLPALTKVVHTSSGACERVRGHAASALINLVDPDHCPRDAIQPHLEAVLGSLLSCLTGGAPLSVQSPCLTLLGWETRTWVWGYIHL